MMKKLKKVKSVNLEDLRSIIDISGAVIEMLDEDIEILYKSIDATEGITEYFKELYTNGQLNMEYYEYIDELCIAEESLSLAKEDLMSSFVLLHKLDDEYIGLCKEFNQALDLIESGEAKEETTYSRWANILIEQAYLSL